MKFVVHKYVSKENSREHYLIWHYSMIRETQVFIFQKTNLAAKEK
jgi:hypothetical protein